MTITISPGLKFAFLITSFITDANTSFREVLIYSFEGVNGNDMPLLGLPFFSAAYLLVDQNHERFTLSSANPNTIEERLIPIGATACTSLACNGTSFNEPDQSSRSTNAGNTISPGGIADIVIGVVATLAIISILLFLYRRRRRARPSRPQLTSEKSDPRLSAYLAFKPEMPTNIQLPQEMPSEQNPSHITALYETAGWERQAEQQKRRKVKYRRL
ncbi:MAG: hypothetical protein LQ343_006014 [Gyalolechia ehrenbergii]|nr:MAG: hypothetical protein LQ343_006014 [Gyalolechia ehrenbergii]